MVEIQLALGRAPLIAGEKRILAGTQEYCRAGGIRTRGLLHPRQALYQAEPQPELLRRSNPREHLFRVLRGRRQDRISEHLGSQGETCASFVRGAAVSPWRRPRQTKQQANKQSTKPTKYALLR